MDISKKDVSNIIKIYKDLNKSDIPDLFKSYKDIDIDRNLYNTIDKFKKNPNKMDFIYNNYTDLKQDNKLKKNDIKNIISVFHNKNKQEITNILHKNNFNIKSKNSIKKLKLQKDPYDYINKCLKYYYQQQGGYVGSYFKPLYNIPQPVNVNPDTMLKNKFYKNRFKVFNMLIKLNLPTVTPSFIQTFKNDKGDLSYVFIEFIFNKIPKYEIFKINKELNKINRFRS